MAKLDLLKEYLILRGAAFGLAAGVNTLTFTEPLGLSDAPVTRTNKTKTLTVARCTLGDVVAAAVFKTLRK